MPTLFGVDERQSCRALGPDGAHPASDICLGAMIMRKWLKVLIGIAVVAVIAVAVVLFSTTGMVDTANAFFKAIRQQDMPVARGYLSQDFRASTSDAALKRFLSGNALLHIKEASWPSRQISGGRGELEGSLTTETGGVIPVKMVFVKENDAWKIYAIHKPAAGLQASDASPELPTRADQIALVKQSIRDFLAAVAKKDMTSFHASLSRMWQKQITVDKLDKAFRSVIDAKVDWAALNDLQPELSATPRIDENGVLILAGRYPTQPIHVTFEQKYVHEGVAWKLIGFNFQAQKK